MGSSFALIIRKFSNIPNSDKLKGYPQRAMRRVTPLLTVETEVNGDSKRTHDRVLSWLVRRTRRACTRDFGPALAALISPVQNIIFLTVHFFTINRQAGVLGRLSVCLWLCDLTKTVKR